MPVVLCCCHQRENAVAIEPDEVTAIVVQYRPIYVNGDVSKPGEQAFRPFMTVRQAITLSGGYDILRIRMENPILLSADLRGEYESLWTEFAKERARVSRFNTELGEKDTLDQKLLADVPVSPSRKAEIVSVEAEHLRTEQADYEREKTFLQHSIKQGDEQIKVLSEQNTKEEQGMQADAEELQRINELFGKGALPSPRVTDARRAVLLSSTRKRRSRSSRTTLQGSWSGSTTSGESSCFRTFRMPAQGSAKFEQSCRAPARSCYTRRQGRNSCEETSSSRSLRSSERAKAAMSASSWTRTPSSSQAMSSRLPCGWTTWLEWTSSLRRRASQPRRNRPSRRQAPERPRRRGKPPLTRLPETRRLRPLGQPRAH